MGDDEPVAHDPSVRFADTSPFADSAKERRR
jgi:hypothetical protein